MLGSANTQSPGYFSATKHAWPTLLFLLPLLGAYEGGVIWMGGEQSEALRNGADAWLRWALQVFGLKHILLMPMIVLGWLLLRSVLGWGSRPSGNLGIVLGMAVESGIFALGLWSLSRNFGPLLEHFGIPLQVPAQWTANELAMARIITFVGAGIYEEVLFRLLIFSGMVLMLRIIFFPKFLAIPIAAIGSALLFAAAHHIGTYGEPFDRYVFLFRAAAGLYFAFLYQFRGFGVAVGTHAGYDVLVGLQLG
ncbi:abortive infection protein : CAAX amino terminal protease family OS=Singulisphaera acidiphila (strain ATCC BAA-1392 / DSM 18658 / VKM B-2454 / MOB10) GN=Sinac_6883 PE=4 SV=1: Abi [Tuwongella immobilis]|uniref:CAAX prenyl protease 2/Lysostaphin resistance protein A-like domain-containing protein n=2 Tax=Tuwongella immobilis TaxID=692036 RepID=A0A6C2YJT6_9BACT|nr:abortive infection protein : CAAX amino terminal protease family OS=Singulisphaera acidiphila (strain ATCC BAA-1392 / DSM 18658 / VKM B-2454 / MOB10) GN=Sinac_6883 PE=4 SV=1: Abi [Tuwongella immobilis]VTR99608.1 abortive infection protein : CAAX amino terminal protease family OS=Singulisphaera acidiphila (strain ATCC BAA-1392 / DSM 18658 / VKM B-2454 / MOB10) GN=Sinac_6883 PE=4 SV=1: Abi [Tuwongella immobilis]